MDSYELALNALLKELNIKSDSHVFVLDEIFYRVVIQNEEYTFGEHETAPGKILITTPEDLFAYDIKSNKLEKLNPIIG